MLSDIDLIRAFVHNCTKNKQVVLSNLGLSAQTVNETNQLIAQTDGTILIYKLGNTPGQFLIKANSSCWELMNQVLAEYNFLLVGELNSRGFYKYEYCEPPKGYQMNCNKSIMLWRVWWKYRKQSFQVGIPLQLLIRKRRTWYPIKDLLICDGLLYVKTLGNEIPLHPDDLVTWLSKIDKVNSQN
jgi:hypothetical protein